MSLTRVCCPDCHIPLAWCECIDGDAKRSAYSATTVRKPCKHVYIQPTVSPTDEVYGLCRECGERVDGVVFRR